MPISKIKTSSITGDAASINLNIDAGTLFLDATNNRVGLGTTSPGNQLVVYGTGGDAVSLFSGTTTTGAADTGNAIVFSGHDGAVLGRLFGRIGVYKENSTVGNVSSYMSFGTRLDPAGTVEKMRITSAGNVGIGTTTIGTKLVVADTGQSLVGTAYNVADFTNAGQTLGTRIGYDSSNGAVIASAGVDKPIAFWQYNTSNYVERMRITSTGDVGIGTTSPTTSAGYTSLSINNATNSGYVVLQNNGTNKSDWYISGGTGPAYLRGVNVALGLAATGSNNIVFETNGAERMRISSTGNLAFGTSETGVAKVNIQLAGTNVSGDTTGATMGAGAIFQLNNTNASQTNSTIMLLGGGTSNNVGQISSGIGFSRESENTWGTQLRFYTHNSATDVLSTLKERMRIDSNGLLNINTTSDIADAYVQVSIDSAVRGTAFVCRPTTNTTTNAMVFRNSSNGNAGYIQYNASTTTYVTSSDYRLKENVAPMTGALAKVSQLKPCTFTWKADGSAGQGFIAHELAEVCPQAVTGEKDALRADGEMDTQGVDTSFLVATLTAAMQEQQTLITQLTERIAALENK